MAAKPDLACRFLVMPAHSEGILYYAYQRSGKMRAVTLTRIDKVFSELKPKRRYPPFKTACCKQNRE